jgi:ADP-ribose pyrophosphatase YjhB (NUDIX family)
MAPERLDRGDGHGHHDCAPNESVVRKPYASLMENGRLSDPDWTWATGHLPIVCVDVLPVRYDPGQRISGIGLIRRDSPFGPVWCHVGGRVLLGETLAEAARRHLKDSLESGGESAMATSPYFVNQYFREQREGEGWDPRKHAVAACFLAEFAPADTPKPTGTEAIDFRWFGVDELPAEAEMWPGTMAMIDHPALAPAEAGLESYHALTARSVSHNELLWQTPVLAMTAMAFLLTIALGESDDWRRALAAALSAVIAVASAQLFARHSASQLKDADALCSLESRLGMLPINRKPPSLPRKRLMWPTRNELAQRRSRDWWFRSLLLFAGVSTVLCVGSIIGAVT